MRINILLLIACLLNIAALAAGDDKPEQRPPTEKLIAVLKTDAPQFDKAQACRQLAIAGDKAAVPALAALLGDEKLSAYARTALETTADPSAAEALRAAIPQLKGALLAGVVNSLGVRRDAEAVDALAKLAADRSSGVADEALAALGAIATPKAIATLRQVLAGPAEARAAAAVACLTAADRLADKNKADSLALREAVMAADVPAHLRAAALQGAIVARQAEGLSLLAAQLQSTDGALFTAAVRAAQRMPGDAVASALLAAMKQVPPARQASLVAALGQRQEAAVLPAISQAAASGPAEVRLAALDVLGQRGDRAALDVVRTAADDPSADIRGAALATLGKIVALDDLALLTDRLLAAKSSEEVAAVQQALAVACARMADIDGCAERLGQCMAKGSTEVKCLVLDLLGRIGGAKALALVAANAKAGDDALQDAATRALGAWPNAEAAPVLLELATSASDGKYRVRAVRGYLRIARQFDLPTEVRNRMCADALRVAEREDEKKLARDVLARIALANARALFDGRTFNGWEGDTAKSFRIEQGAIVGGNLKQPIPRNEFLCTTKTYKNFVLRLECKLVGPTNGGIQIRSARVPNHNEVSGYQADMSVGADGGYWGCLYDESRRKKMLAAPEKSVIGKAVKADDWNRYEIRCEGPRIRLSVNGVQTVDYTETDPSIPQSGIIGLQIHGGKPSEAWYRNITIEELP